MKIRSNIFIVFILMLSLTQISFSQIFHPVKWTFTQKQISKDEAELMLNANIEPNWYLYSQFIEKGGPIPTNFKFNKSADIKLVGNVAEPKPEVKHDENFDMDLKVFHNSATFKQKVKILSKIDFVVSGTLEYMCCDNKRCLPPEEVDFKFNLKGNPNANSTSQTNNTATPQITKSADQQPDNSADQQVNNLTSQQPNKSTTQQVNNPTSQQIPKSEGSSLWSFFIIALIAGLAGTLTPCVFPMIPMTVTFFVNSGSNRRKSILTAIVYGLSIIAIYTLIGILVSLLKSDADTLNMISTHWVTNIIFFSLFIVFAASFFGLFEMTLPSWIITKSDKQADKGGYLGAFFMAVTLVLVSFSCTGPIVGAILIEAAGGLMLKPVIGMFGFGLAFSIPFLILALFPSFLSNLPKSGGWLNSIKIVMAFIILAFSLKFLVSADQTYHWNLLSRDMFLAIWIVLFAMLGFYLLGKLRFKLDSEVKHISFLRFILSGVSFIFVIYLFTGLLGANLNLISGFLPPPSEKTLLNNNNSNQQISTLSNQQIGLCDNPKYANLFHLPYNLQGYFDYKQAMECAKQQNKPLFISFTGHACSNCHKMENNVWSDPEVLKRLQNDYVILVLYVDDPTELPQSDWVTSSFDGKVKKTIGKINADFRISHYNANSQPFYVLLDTNEKLLNSPMQYDLSVSHFIQFLDSGIAKFKQLQS